MSNSKQQAALQEQINDFLKDISDVEFVVVTEQDKLSARQAAKNVLVRFFHHVHPESLIALPVRMERMAGESSNINGFWIVDVKGFVFAKHLDRAVALRMVKLMNANLNTESI